MQPQLSAYFDERLKEWTKQFPSVRAAIVGSGSASMTAPALYPIALGPNRYGELAVEGKASPEAAAGLSQQLACVWAMQNVATAIELDRKIAAFASEHSQFYWTGVYRRMGETLVLTCFRGPATPHPVISVSDGICGAAVRENASLNIPDVNADPRYLACNTITRSELVVPIRDARGTPIGEVDIDSKELGAFGAKLQKTVEDFANSLAGSLERV